MWLNRKDRQAQTDHLRPNLSSPRLRSSSVSLRLQSFPLSPIAHVPLDLPPCSRHGAHDALGLSRGHIIPLGRLSSRRTPRCLVRSGVQRPLHRQQNRGHHRRLLVAPRARRWESEKDGSGHTYQGGQFVCQQAMRVWELVPGKGARGFKGDSRVLSVIPPECTYTYISALLLLPAFFPYHCQRDRNPPKSNSPVGVTSDLGNPVCRLAMPRRRRPAQSPADHCCPSLAILLASILSGGGLGQERARESRLPRK